MFFFKKYCSGTGIETNSKLCQKKKKKKLNDTQPWSEPSHANPGVVNTHTETRTLSRRQCHTWTRARPRLSAKHTSQLLYGDCGLTPARADDVSRPLVDRGNLDGHVTASGVNVQDMSLQMTLKSGVVVFFSFTLPSQRFKRPAIKFAVLTVFLESVNGSGFASGEEVSPCKVPRHKNLFPATRLFT